MSHVLLNYRKDGRKRRLHRALAFVLVIAALLVSWKYGMPLLRQISYLRDQNACLQYSPANGLIGYSQSAPDTNSLLARQGFGQVHYFLANRDMASPAAGFRPRCLERLMPEMDYGVVFMHERTTPKGLRLLVVINFLPCTADRQTQCSLATYSWMITPPSKEIGSRARADWNSDLGFLIGGREKFVVQFGSVDPDDGSHFIIPYELNGEKGVIDGWLRDHRPRIEDGIQVPANVDLVVRSGPALKR